MVSKFSRAIVPVTMAIVLVAAVAHVASSNSGGFGGHMGHRGMRGGMGMLGVPLPLLLKTANLTDAQKQQIQTIRENNRKNPAFRTALATYLKARMKVRDEINATQAATSDDAAALGAAEAQLAVVRMQQQNEIKAILSGDQLKTWNEFQAKRDSRIQDRINKLTQPES